MPSPFLFVHTWGVLSQKLENLVRIISVNITLLEQRKLGTEKQLHACRNFRVRHRLLFVAKLIAGERKNLQTLTFIFLVQGH